MKSRNFSTFTKSGKVAWEVAGEGIRRKILGYDERLMLVLVEFEKGAVGTPHRHHHSQVSYVVKGVLEVEIDGSKRVLVKGDAFCVPSESIHGAVALEASILIDTFAPMRREFITNRDLDVLP